MDATTVAAGLLHDVLEDTATSKDDLEREFGGEIAELVDGVTKIGKLAFSTREERQAENFRKMLVAMARDIRVLMIKLADRLHNMRTLHYLPPEKAEIARETLDIYAPLAHRLGMAKVKGELEDLALTDARSRGLRGAPAPGGQAAPRARGGDQPGHHDPDDKLAEVGHRSKITGRPKHFYSIYKKMQRAAGSSTRSTTSPPCASSPPTVRECYGALGRGPLALEARARPLQGLHRDAQGRTCTSRSTRRSSGPRAIPWRSRSARPRCTGSPRRGSPPTGSTRRRRRPRRARRRPSCGCGSCWSGRRR